MRTRFIHTADWQLGRPFARVEDLAKRALLQQERLAVVARIAAVAREERADFAVVAGDVFDSTHVGKSTVAAACSAIGALQIPVYVIPGNHDHGGPGSVWEQTFFRREAEQLAPNLRWLLSAEPVELDTAILFPCPLMRRHDVTDTTQWLRGVESVAPYRADKTRIILAHGSTQLFGSAASDEDHDELAHNLLDLARLPAGQYDYIALGDWHGTKKVGPCAWYAGTPELDRFPKGSDHDAGNILSVTAERGASPEVKKIRTARLGWHQLDFTFVDDRGVGQLASRLETLLEQRAGQDLLHLELNGSLGLDASSKLEHLLESYQARLLRLKLVNGTVVAPSPEETIALTSRVADPLIARVAAKLVARSLGETASAPIARIALRELHAQLNHR